ncbi:hypothetical protein EBL_c39930 [Shimwellia blattae DSM 4481 = NBRC 105725]|uniref:Uncharacterized protein n=1 Tax=Shimwellia blattae (strain ATCC 29907 / DSM 4481 / JCM 1650 / NBRC 105725 / CDC 9005-74) TaxID=630626 RepID=I2BER3_SHIBC|nr:hypothetical protein EBL_c39930 [Shimwellia blattae DSM 4481 = NBRC 105725]
MVSGRYIFVQCVSVNAGVVTTPAWVDIRLPQGCGQYEGRKPAPTQIIAAAAPVSS